MHNWNVNGLANDVKAFVRRVGAEHNRFGSCGLQSLRGIDDQIRDALPIVFDLQAMNVSLVKVRQQQRRVGVVAEVIVHRLIDDAVVLDGRVPRSPADQTEASHPLPTWVQGRCLFASCHGERFDWEFWCISKQIHGWLFSPQYNALYIPDNFLRPNETCATIDVGAPEVNVSRQGL